MRRSILILALSAFLVVGCHTENAAGPFDYERDTPVWLKAKIDSISDGPLAFGVRVYRYEWRGEFVYHIENPISSCAYCELYDQTGAKMQFPDNETFEDFLTNKKNRILIWEWTD